jgi:hypothetical protein
MIPQRDELEAAPRAELIRLAKRAGVQRPDVMTRMELVDEILRLATRDPVERRKVRGFLGIARDLIASVVEQGLNLPDAAALIRGEVTFEPRRPPQGPVATVTLAEIYAAQGHLERARAMIDEVLRAEPDHEVALTLRERFRADAARKGRVPAGSASGAGSEATARAEHEALAAIVGDTPAEEAATVPARPLAVLLRRAPGQWTVAWDLGASPRGALHVRALEVIPREDGAPVRREHGIDAEGVMGSITLNDIDETAIVRAAVGYRGEDGFRAAAVAAEVERSADGEARITWTLRREPPGAAALGRLAGLGV